MPATSLFARGLVALLVTGGLTVAAAPQTASATSTRLCLGYAGCARAGYSDSGYQKSSGTMWWRMYSGHNCTNYAAYRMVHSGLPNTRPWTGSGNATNWGVARSDITDQTPRVGAVAWWRAYAPPAGSAGHVAYVEKVISNDEIIVSQDSWGGDFSWARITRAGGSWPSGFVHFNDVGLRNSARPVISGTAKVGGTLSSTSGSWTPSGTTISYQWRADGVNIPGARSRTFTPTTAQQGKQIAILVQASKPGYRSAHSYSLRTAAVLPGVLSSTSAPTVTGTPRVDAPLTVTPGAWTPAPTAVTYQWSADGAAIKGATGTTLTPTPDLVGKVLGVTVTAARTGYKPVSTTLRLAAVSSASFTTSRSPSVTGEPWLGTRLTLDEGAVSPAPTGTAVRWLRAGVPVAGADAPTYVTTTADLGKRVVAQVVRTRPGYTTWTDSTVSTRRIRTVPSMRVRTQAGKQRVEVWVALTAPGVSQVNGVVRVNWRGKILHDQALRGGKADVVLRGLPAGERHLHIYFFHTRTVASHGEHQVVQIR